MTKSMDFFAANPAVPYRLGSADATGMDCSGAIFFLLKQSGQTPPRSAHEQYLWMKQLRRLTAVTTTTGTADDPALAAPRPGDLVFYAHRNPDTNAEIRASHVHLYLGREADGHAIMLGSSEGRYYRGSRISGFGITDYHVPTADSPTRIIGYGPPPPIPAPSPAKTLRVLTWNIHHGEGADGRVDLKRIAAVISRLDPDVVMLQEVDHRCTRSGSIDQAAELARLTGLKGVFGKAMDLQGGAYGQAILSRLDLTNMKLHRLPGDGEPRIAMSAEVDTPLGPLTVASVHLDFTSRQERQAAACAAALLTERRPLVLAGDFNARLDAPAMADFARPPWRAVAKGGAAATEPADKPVAEIDHVVVRGLRGVSPATVIDEPLASDHRPVLAVIGLPE